MKGGPLLVAVGLGLLTASWLGPVAGLSGRADQEVVALLAVVTVGLGCDRWAVEHVRGAYRLVWGVLTLGAALLVLTSGAKPVQDDALQRAVVFGRVEEVRELLAQGVDPDERGGAAGFAALHHAAKAGAVEAMEGLIDGGATVDLPSTRGLTPLMVGAMACRAEVVAVLLARGADARRTDTSGLTAASYAEDCPAGLQERLR